MSFHVITRNLLFGLHSQFLLSAASVLLLWLPAKGRVRSAAAGGQSESACCGCLHIEIGQHSIMYSLWYFGITSKSHGGLDHMLSRSLSGSRRCLSRHPFSWMMLLAAVSHPSACDIAGRTWGRSPAKMQWTQEGFFVVKENINTLVPSAKKFGWMWDWAAVCNYKPSVGTDFGPKEPQERLVLGRTACTC